MWNHSNNNQYGLVNTQYRPNHHVIHPDAHRRNSHVPVMLHRVTPPVRPDGSGNGKYPRQQASKPQELGPGVKVDQIEGLNLKVVKMLGKGSFGSVWEVESRGSESQVIALKETTTSAAITVDDAAFEVQMLKQLTDAAEKDQRINAPRYLGHCKVRLPNGQTKFLMAMTKIDGVPLDWWLYNVKTEKFKDININHLVQNPESMFGKVFRSMSFAQATRTASGFLFSLTPTFEANEKLAFHRDCNVHNILVSENPSGSLDATLIDFGLAVDSRKWTSGGWKKKDIGGDVRYWPPSSWMMYQWGHNYVEGHANRGFMDQYVKKLDIFTLGLTVTEMFFNLVSSDELSRQHATVQTAHEAFMDYWFFALHTFQVIMRDSRTSIRSRLTKLNVAVKYDQKLKLLRRSMRMMKTSIPEAKTLMLVLGDMISENGRFQSWLHIRMHLEQEQVGKDKKVKIIPEQDKKDTPGPRMKQPGPVDLSGFVSHVHARVPGTRAHQRSRSETRVRPPGSEQENPRVRLDVRPEREKTEEKHDNETNDKNREVQIIVMSAPEAPSCFYNQLRSADQLKAAEWRSKTWKNEKVASTAETSEADLKNEQTVSLKLEPQEAPIPSGSQNVGSTPTKVPVENVQKKMPVQAQNATPLRAFSPVVPKRQTLKSHSWVPGVLVNPSATPSMAPTMGPSMGPSMTPLTTYRESPSVTRRESMPEMTKRTQGTPLGVKVIPRAVNKLPTKDLHVTVIRSSKNVSQPVVGKASPSKEKSEKLQSKRPPRPSPRLHPDAARKLI